MRFGVREDGRIEEAGVEEGSFVAGGVGPGEVTCGETRESFGLVVAGQFAGPDVVGCSDGGGIVGVGREDEPIAGGRVPDNCLSVLLKGVFVFGKLSSKNR